MAHWSTSFSNCALNLPRMKTAESWKVGWALCTLSAWPEGTGTATDSLCVCVLYVNKTLLILSAACQCMDAHCGFCVCVCVVINSLSSPGSVWMQVWTHWLWHVLYVSWVCWRWSLCPWERLCSPLPVCSSLWLLRILEDGYVFTFRLLKCMHKHRAHELYSLFSQNATVPWWYTHRHAFTVSSTSLCAVIWVFCALLIALNELKLTTALWWPGNCSLRMLISVLAQTHTRIHNPSSVTKVFWLMRVKLDFTNVWVIGLCPVWLYREVRDEVQLP